MADTPPIKSSLPVNELELVHCAQQGDSGAFSTLVLTHQTFVYNVILRMVGDPVEAQDLAQDTFVRAWRALPQFRGEAQFRTWLYRIAVNLVYNQRPKIKREMASLPVDDVEELPMPAANLPEVGAERAERRTFLYRQIEQLSPSYRLLVMLRYQQDLSYEEIADVVGMPLGTVKTGLFRAHAQLRKALGEHEKMTL